LNLIEITKLLHRSHTHRSHTQRIVPTLRVGMPYETLCVEYTQDAERPLGVPTQSMGTIA